MSFLKKLGQVIAKGISVVAEYGPLALRFVPGAGPIVAAVTSELTQIAQIIVLIEAAFQAPGSGPDKLKAATPLVAQAILNSSLVAGHEIHDQALFLQGSSKIADGTVDVLNSLKS